MKKTITITIEEYKCLREYLNQAMEIFQRLGVEFGSEIPPKPKPKQTKSQGIEKYKNLITSGVRAKKPERLKK